MVVGEIWGNAYLGKSNPQVYVIKMSKLPKNNPTIIRKLIIYPLERFIQPHLPQQLGTEEYEAEVSMSMTYWLL